MFQKLLKAAVLASVLGLAPGEMLCRAQTQADTQSQAQTKLYLKDGTYEVVRGYEIQSDRVRFYSVERSEWEEIPKDQVDFDATRRAAEEEKQIQHQQVEQARKIETERFPGAGGPGYQVAPGMRLPNEEGVFAFDGSRVIRLVQSSAEVVKDKKRLALMMAMPAPLLKSRNMVEIAGPKAAIRLREQRPAFYFQLSGLKPENIQLVPLRATKTSRIVEKIQGGIGVGKSGEIRQDIAIETTEVAPGIYKVQPKQPLATGEYAFGELLGENLNIDVWDFGIETPSKQTPQQPSSGGQPQTKF
jgi:hypothetical protein